MSKPTEQPTQEPTYQIDLQEKREWLDALESVYRHGGVGALQELIRELQVRANSLGVVLPFTANTPYINSIHKSRQPAFPGNREVEWRIRSIIRWNAMAMVVRANKQDDGIGGHISTYASAAMLYEVGFNHFFKGKDHADGGDMVYFQGHASPGIYARAFLEGRISQEQLENFRHEIGGKGLSSYPHPRLMPGFWEFPTVSMGLSPIMAIYQARFNHYLKDRGLRDTAKQKVWAFLGDGETDEPETLGAITLASREKLDNLVFVVNCNLQRLDGPVRGNGKIIQELEAAFRGAGWNVIKVIWGRDWDSLLDKDHEGALVKRMGDAVDGEYQKYVVSDGAYIREHFFGADPALKTMVRDLSDEQIRRLRRGGHDVEKVYAAFAEAAKFNGKPTVVLAKTIKGYGLGESGEGKNITHQQKKLNEDELRSFRTRFSIPISDDEVAKAPFYKPAEDSAEIRYLRERREALGGFVPERRVKNQPIETPAESVFEEFYKGSGDRGVSTTMAFVRILTKLLRDEKIGKNLVPIVPDEARTFGMEGLFRQCGIYAHSGQLYEPVDADSLMYYKESTDGQILEEGITEAGAMSSFIAAGTAYATHGINMIPFFIYYSMFGMQRIGDQVWAAGDMGCKGFLIGGTAGRTTLAGEGLQHQDGHSHLLASAVPNLISYDPAFAYEIAVLVREGIDRMYRRQEDAFYYITVGNENYTMPEMPSAAVKDGIIRGLYLFKSSELKKSTAKVNLFGCGAILNEVILAAKMLEEKYQIAADIWSLTSFNEIRRDAQAVERWNRLHPTETQKTCYLQDQLKGRDGVFVFATDYVKSLTDSLAPWVPGTVVSLGTDGFGRSDNRKNLREFFEVNSAHIVVSTLSALARDGKIKADVAKSAIAELGIHADKVDPAKG